VQISAGEGGQFLIFLLMTDLCNIQRLILKTAQLDIHALSCYICCLFARRQKCVRRCDIRDEKPTAVGSNGEATDGTGEAAAAFDLLKWYISPLLVGTILCCGYNNRPIVPLPRFYHTQIHTHSMGEVNSPPSLLRPCQSIL